MMLARRKMGRRLGRQSLLSNGPSAAAAATAAAEGESAPDELPSSDASESVSSLASLSDEEGDVAEEEEEQEENEEEGEGDGDWTVARAAGLARLLPAVAATAAARLDMVRVVEARV